jgi:hypothetical protein
MFWGLRGDDHGGGCLVVSVEVEEADAHGGAAASAIRLRFYADDRAELRDHHHLCGVVDERDAGDLPDLGHCSHVDHTLAAEGL